MLCVLLRKFQVNMKNLGTILSVLALAGVIYLLVNQNTSVDSSSAAEPTEVKPKVSGEAGVSIAFVNSDTLLAKYDLHQEFMTKLEGKAADIEKDLERRTKAFQESIRTLEQYANTMSQQQLQQGQLELQQKQQEIMRIRDERTQELALEERDLNLAIKADMDSVLVRIKKREGYDFIFSYGPASELLMANPAYDITDIVVKELNEAYQKNQESKESAE